MIKEKKISAIVPIYNECPHLNDVISNIIKINCIDEFICINDGSTDNSLDVLEKYNNRVNIITYEENRGKGFAIAQGLKVAEGDIVLFLDSDIIDYDDEKVREMVIPIIKGESDYTARAARGKLEHVVFKAFCGIRAYWKKDVYPLIRRLENSSKYGIEPILNRYLKDKKVKYIRVEDYGGYFKFDKYSKTKAVREYYKEAKSLAIEYARIIRDQTL